MFAWTPVDRDFDVLTPVIQPENVYYIALDSFYWITTVLATFLTTLTDTRVLLSAMRTQVEVHTNFHQTELRSTSPDLAYQNYDTTLTRALDEMLNSHVDALFENDDDLT